jgi:hypothetical protein
MPPWSPEVLIRLHEVEYNFHVRAFGEEMARVNFLPLEQRRAYIGEMFDHAHKKGVRFGKDLLATPVSGTQPAKPN